MHDTLIKMKDGRTFCGPIWLWRPQYGYLTLSGEGWAANFNHPIQFSEMESAVTKGRRDHLEQSVVEIEAGCDELARARGEQKYPHEFTVHGNLGLQLSSGTFVVEEFSGSESAFWEYMKKARTPGIADPCLLVRTRPVNLPLERGELAGFKGRLQTGFNILMFSEEVADYSWFWIRDSFSVDPKDAKMFER